MVKPSSTSAFPFAGRAGELSLLRLWADEARQGHPRVVLIEGEEGFGKSALLSRFLTGIDGACVLRASGDEAEALLLAVFVNPGYVGNGVGWSFGAFVGLIAAIVACAPLATPMLRARSSR
jgi:hypothetical protein